MTDRGHLQGDEFCERKVKITPECGIAFLMINDTGFDSVKGTIVECSKVVPCGYVISVVDSNHAMGVVYQSGIPDGQETWIVRLGYAFVLLEDGTASNHGNWVRTSLNQMGRADATGIDPPGGGIIELDNHLKEIGYAQESISAGTNKLCRIFVNFL